jgi:redox-sensitive bicupin YhaK (pirin superfamily)
MSAVETTIIPPSRDIGDGFMVRRALPSPGRRMVGPFVFLDQMGPAHFEPPHALDVRPHPHINLATLTYLIEGEILHADSLGSHQPIRPGEVNWMTAGSGIVHSERSPQSQRQGGATLMGLQNWLALPVEHEETAPQFLHYAAGDIPTQTDTGLSLSLIAGQLDGQTSPVKTFSDLVYADVSLAPGGRYKFAADHVERAIYTLSGALRVEGQEGSFAPSQLVVLRPGAEVVLSADTPTRAILLGGEPFAEKRYLYWNFVSSRPDRIEQAKQDWREGRFPKVPGDEEWIPLPPDVPGAKLV